jgi:hypothetical protein
MMFGTFARGAGSAIGAPQPVMGWPQPAMPMPVAMPAPQMAPAPPMAPPVAPMQQQRPRQSLGDTLGLIGDIWAGNNAYGTGFQQRQQRSFEIERQAAAQHEETQRQLAVEAYKRANPEPSPMMRDVCQRFIGTRPGDERRRHHDPDRGRRAIYLFLRNLGDWHCRHEPDWRDNRVYRDHYDRWTGNGDSPGLARRDRDGVDRD